MIVPALLTDNKEKLLEMLNSCHGFTDFAQVDIMDGAFVPSSSVSLGDIKSIKSPINFEAHLMVEDPCAWINPFKSMGAKRIIFHLEIKKSLEEKFQIIEKIKNAGLSVGIAINPPTSIDGLKPFIEKIDMVLFMSVIPGFYGAPFVPEVLDKVKAFHSNYPDIPIGIDGGMKLENAPLAKAVGVKYVCVGSALMKAECPKDAYKELVGSVNE